MAYVAPEDHFQQPGTDMSRRYRLPPEVIAREAVRLSEGEAKPHLPIGASDAEALAFALSQKPPMHGLQADIRRDFIEMIEAGRPTKKDGKSAQRAHVP